MSIESQQMILTVQVNIKGYETVEALKTICVTAKDKMDWGLYPSEKRIEINKLIKEILDLA